MSTARSSQRRSLVRAAAVLVATVSAGAWTAGVHAERPLLADELPPELEGVGIVERLGETIPMDVAFVDDAGRPVTIGEYFGREGDERRPVILTFNYFRCPMLCDMTLNGLVEGMRGLKWSAGEDFEVITLSVAPHEGPDLASVKKRAYMQQYNRDGAASGWHFLTGTQDNIETLAKAAGFGYRETENTTGGETPDYAHTASIMFLTPDGRLSRYMNDVLFEPRDLRLGLVEASEGNIGSPMEKFLLFMCYHYDPDANSYAMSAMKLMRLGGGITLLAIITTLVVLWRRGSHHEQEKVALGGLQT